MKRRRQQRSCLKKDSKLYCFSRHLRFSPYHFFLLFPIYLLFTDFLQYNFQCKFTSNKAWASSFLYNLAVIMPFVSRPSSACFVRALCQCVSSPWWWGCAVSHACEHVHLSELVWHHTDCFAWAAEGEGSQPNIGIHLKFKLKALWSLLYLSVA